MAINLKTTVVESREQRLGTIVSWNGAASDLAEESRYAKGCGSGCGTGKARRICETDAPFTQGSICSEMMVGCQAGQIRDAVLVQHAPIGCAAAQNELNLLFRDGLSARGKPVHNVRHICTNLTEGDMVFGGVDKLEQSIRDAWERHKPPAIFVGTSCATGIIGDDVDQVTQAMEEELGIPVVPLHCEGFRSKHWSTGFDAAQHGLLRQIVRKNPVQKQDDLVNVIHLWGSDVFTPILGALGLRPNYVMNLASVEELAQMSEAIATVSFCYTLSSYLAAGLEQEFGVPEVKAPMPYGLKATDEWLREIGRVTGREKEAEAYIASEHERVLPKLEVLRKKLAGKNGYVATGSAYAHGLIAVLRELGMTVDGSTVFHHDPIYDSQDPKQDSLSFTIDTYGDVPRFNVGNRQQYQLYEALQHIHPDVILIRHNGLSALASRLGVPAIALGDEHYALGYQGVLNIGETILDVLGHRKFHLDVAAHTKLPYRKWWLDDATPNAKPLQTAPAS